jgi:nicotinamidase-related amidase
MVNLVVHNLLTPDNCVVTFIDHQPQMLFGVANFDRQAIINNVVGFAKATKAFNVPVVLSTVETKSFSGYIWPQLRAVFPEHELYERTLHRRPARSRPHLRAQPHSGFLALLFRVLPWGVH